MVKKYACVLALSLCVLNTSIFARDFVAIFAPGLGGNSSMRFAYSSLVACDIIGVDGPEVKGGFFTSSLGQQADIDALVTQIEACIEQEKYIVAIGVSKGAATWINTIGWLAENKPDYLKHIQALILESPFADPAYVSVHAFGQLEPVKKSGVMLEGKAIQDLFTNYDPEGVTPIKAVREQWGSSGHKNMIVVLIHGQHDSLIPVSESQDLCKAMAAAGFKNTYLITPAIGRHAQVCSVTENKVCGKVQTVFFNHGLRSLFVSNYFEYREPERDEWGYEKYYEWCGGGVSVNKDGEATLSSDGQRWLHDMQPYASKFPCPLL